MTVEDLIKKLQEIDPKAPIIVEDFDSNFTYNILYVDYCNGECVIYIDER